MLSVLFHKDILYVNVKLVCDEELFNSSVRAIAKSDLMTLPLCVEAYQYNWLNTIIRPMVINITIPLNAKYNLVLTNCKLMDLRKGETTAHVTFSLGGKTIEAVLPPNKNRND